MDLSVLFIYYFSSRCACIICLILDYLFDFSKIISVSIIVDWPDYCDDEAMMSNNVLESINVMILYAKCINPYSKKIVLKIEEVFYIFDCIGLYINS